MLKHRFTFLFAVCLALTNVLMPFTGGAALAAARTPAQPTAGAAAEAATPGYVQGQLVVKLAPTALAAMQQSAVTEAATEITPDITPEDTLAAFNTVPSLNDLNQRFEVLAISAALEVAATDEVAQHLGLDRVFVVHVPPETDIWEMAAAYGADANVEYAEPSTLLQGERPASTPAPVLPEAASPASPAAPLFPDDPYFPYQDSLNNTGQLGGTPGADVDAPEAWEVQTGSADVLIAVLDTGVDATVEDLQGKLRLDLAYDFVDGDNVPQDDDGHGTHVAGVIAAKSNNGTGSAGVCWGCEILPLRVGTWVLHAASLEVAQAIYYAASNEADVINMSLGGQCSRLWADVVNYAYALDVVMVAAAGNLVDLVAYPARFERVIAVSAVDRNDLFAAFSSFGPTVELSAPGSGILITNAAGIDFGSGTTYATAITSGIIGLLRSANPALSVGEIRQILRLSAQDLGDPGVDNYYGFGRVNARSALDLAQTPPTPVVVTGADVCGCVLGDLAATSTVAAAGESGAAAQLEAVDLLYQVRDILFAGSPLGDEITRLYYRHAPQVALLAYQDADLRGEIVEVMETTLPYALAALQAEETRLLDGAVVAQVEALVNTLADRANPALRRDLLATWQTLDLARYVDRPVEEVVEGLREAQQVQPNRLFLPSLGGR